jgi:hypothetical protein
MMKTVDILLSKIVLATPESRKPLELSYPFLKKLDKYCSKFDSLGDGELVNGIFNHPHPVKMMHFWTEALLRTCILYDKRGTPERSKYYKRLQKHAELILHLYTETGSLFYQWHYLYMYATMELFLFQLKWKKAGLLPEIIAPATKVVLDCLKNRIPYQPQLHLPYSYARDVIEVETYQFFD